MSAILLNSGIVHYEVIGRGRPILFLHGWVGSWRYWIPAMQTASMLFRAYAVDFWGYGDSAREDQSRFSMNEQVKLVDNFMQEMGIAKVAIVGHGFGALVGLNFALKNPTMVDRIMAVSAPLDVNSVHPKVKTLSPTELADWLLPRDPSADPARADALKAVQAAITTPFNSPETFNIASRIGSLNTPCLFVYGQNDSAVSQPNYDQAVAPINTHVVTLENCAHFPMLEDTPRFNRLLTDFLALQPGESPRDLQMKEEWRRRVR